MKKALFFILSLALPTVALAQSTAPTSAAGIYDLMTTMAKDGYTDTGVSQAFRLKEGEARLVSLTAPKAGQHVAIAVCDEHCDDIDLQAFDDKGLEIGADFEDDDAPMVELGNKTRVSVVVTMAACGNEDGCEVKIGLLNERHDRERR